MAWSELPWVQRRRPWNTDGQPADVFNRANEALTKALALAPDLPHAHAGRGFTHNWFEFDWGAAQHFQLRPRCRRADLPVPVRVA